MRKSAATVLTAVLMLGLGAILVTRDRLERVSASDAETITWGANDPAWSPDGARIAFSLFGSIWQVAAEGGVAEQITSPYDFPLNTMAALEARRQGGLVTYVHPSPVSSDIFDGVLTAKESPVTAALGAMDSIDVLPFGEGASQIWYRFLNCGFNMAPGAGTDVFTNWRGINQVPGGAREYVEVGPVLSWSRWVDRLWLYLEERNNFGPGDNRGRARKMFDQARAHYGAKLAQAQ